MNTQDAKQLLVSPPHMHWVRDADQFIVIDEL